MTGFAPGENNDPDSPAGQAGIRRGDIIAKIGDQTLDDIHT